MPAQPSKLESRAICRRDAIHENDGERTMRHWKEDLLQFHTKKYPKYLRLTAIMLLQVGGAASERIQHSLKWDRTAKDLLSDTSTYKAIKKDPTPKYKNQLIDQLKTLKDEEVSHQTYRQLYPTTSEVPKFYGLPKVHKPSCPLRPIVASRGSITYDTAKMVANILSPLVGKTDRHLNNSEDLVNKLSKFTLLDSECLVSYDVTALFTSVPVDETLGIIKTLLMNDSTLESRTDLSPQQITELLSTCLKTTYFVYEGNFYIQSEGAAMGSPVSPIIANLFMEAFEEKALSSFSNPPRYWGRYVDDTMVIIQKSDLDSFTAHLNSIHDAIKFTIEHELNNRIAMLDTLITRAPNGLKPFRLIKQVWTLNYNT
ncbi:uncharacterized protein [Amphiura filiformis]|uniref:uncharacterized protein n=1 Tax=Amphiura filiformis TaxID=82378 RepID=UPI003B2264BC